MNQYVAGTMIRRLGESRRLTRHQLAEKLMVSDKAIQARCFFVEENGLENPTTEVKVNAQQGNETCRLRELQRSLLR